MLVSLVFDSQCSDVLLQDAAFSSAKSLQIIHFVPQDCGGFSSDGTFYWKTHSRFSTVCPKTNDDTSVLRLSTRGKNHELSYNPTRVYSYRSCGRNGLSLFSVNEPKKPYTSFETFETFHLRQQPTRIAKRVRLFFNMSTRIKIVFDEQSRRHQFTPRIRNRVTRIICRFF